MVCVSVTVGSPKPIVSGLQANSPAPAQINVSWLQDIAGLVNVSVDSVSIQNVNGTANINSLSIFNVAAGTRSVCVVAV